MAAKATKLCSGQREKSVEGPVEGDGGTGGANKGLLLGTAGNAFYSRWTRAGLAQSSVKGYGEVC